MKIVNMLNFIINCQDGSKCTHSLQQHKKGGKLIFYTCIILLQSLVHPIDCFIGNSTDVSCENVISDGI